MQINLRMARRRDNERAKSLRKCVRDLGCISPKSKTDLDFKTIGLSQNKG